MSDVDPVRPSRPGAGPVDVPNGLAGTPIVATDEGWHPGLDRPTVGGAHQPLWDQTGARYRKSALTFGPVGRVVLTLGVVGVVAVLLTSGVLYLFPMVPLLFFLVPVLRDVWQRAPRQAPTPPGPASSATRGQSGSPR